MNIPCPVKLDCPCTNFPIENYSAEDPDFVRWCATAFAAPNVPLGYNPDCGEGALTAAYAKCCSTVSYADALLCAQQAALAGVVDTWRTENCEPVPRFCNSDQV